VSVAVHQEHVRAADPRAAARIHQLAADGLRGGGRGHGCQEEECGQDFHGGDPRETEVLATRDGMPRGRGRVSREERR